MTKRGFHLVLLIMALQALALSAAPAEDFLTPAHIAVVKPGKLVKVIAKGLFPYGTGNPQANGGTLTISSGTGSASYSLPASGWSANASGSTQKFDDGVCKVQRKFDANGDFVISLKAKCKGNTGTLAVPEPGPVQVALTLANPTLGDTRYCLECGGTPAGNPDKLFKAKDCAAPASCGGGGGQVCGNNVREGTEECDGSDLTFCAADQLVPLCLANCTCQTGAVCQGGSAYPTCGGTCPTGLVCQATKCGSCNPFGDVNRCSCVSPSEPCSTTCPSTGLGSVCPPGQVCVGSPLVFGFPCDHGCVAPPVCGDDTYPTCNGNCVPGLSCVFVVNPLPPPGTSFCVCL